MKKILLVVGIILIIGIAIFFMFGVSENSEGGDSRIGFSLQEFFPFGRGSDQQTSESGTTTNQNENNFVESEDSKPIPRLRKLSREPVAGSIIFTTGTTSVVRFIEKGTGNVYEATSASNKIERLTNTTIPKIIRAFWLPDGSGFLAQTLIPNSEIIETSFVKLNRRNNEDRSGEALTPFVTTISKLPTGIKELAIRPDSGKIFYYIKNRNYTEWYISNPDGTGNEKVYAHHLTEWLPKWISTNSIIMQTKTSFSAPSYMYLFNTQNKSLNKEGFGYNGLSILPRQDNLYSLISIGGPYSDLYLLNKKTLETTDAKSRTFAEKCVWSNKENLTVFCATPNNMQNSAYPDYWYMGLVSMEDSITKMDINNDILFNVSNLTKESGEKIDVVDIKISSDDSHLIFRNKIDGHLWMLRVID